jgi:hypothetical protein
MKTEAVVNAEIELLTAIKKADVPVLEKMLHDDLLFNLPNGNTITKELDLESYRLGRMQIEMLEALDQIITIVDDVAVVAVTVSLRGTYDGNPLVGAYRYIRVWKEFDENLKVIAGSCVVLQ